MNTSDDLSAFDEIRAEMAYLRRHPLTVGDVPTSYPELKALSIFEPRRIQVWKEVKGVLRPVEPSQRLTDKPHIYRLVEGAPILPSTDGRYCRFILQNDAGVFRSFWIQMRCAIDGRDAIEARLNGETRYDGEPCPACGGEEYFAEPLTFNENGLFGHKFGISRCCKCRQEAKAQLKAEQEAAQALSDERYAHYEGLYRVCTGYGRQRGAALATAATRHAAWQQIARDTHEYADGDREGVEHLEWAGVFLDDLKQFNEIESQQ